MRGTLYVVATPIGNMEDITSRAKRVLGEVDIVAAEDTRTAKKLFHILGIKNRVVPNYKFNEKRQVDFLMSELESGKSVALVSDAGTPCISDPGSAVVKAAADSGIKVVGVSGPSSVAVALSVSGFSLDTFIFYGFLPRRGNEARKLIYSAKCSGASVAVFYESPKRIKKALEIFDAEMPGAELCLCNDLTKMYERIYRGAPGGILEELCGNPSAEKGEYTLVVNLGGSESLRGHPGTCPHGILGTANLQSISAEAILVDYVMKNECSVKDAVAALGKTYRGAIAKKEFYDAALNLRDVFSKNPPAYSGYSGPLDHLTPPCQDTSQDTSQDTDNYGYADK